jgi:hypothetical protein
MRTFLDLGEVFDVATLHRQLIADEPAMADTLKRLGYTIPELLGDFRDCDELRRARQKWRNKRPYPNDRQLLSLVIVFSDLLELDLSDEGVQRWTNLTVAIMSLPDPVPSCFWLDTRGEFLLIQCDRPKLRSAWQQAGRRAGQRSVAP